MMGTALTNRSNTNVRQLDDYRSTVTYRPRTDIFETDDTIIMNLDMPGVTKDGLDVSLEQHVLTVRGDIEPKQREGWTLIHSEYAEGNFERAFTLSEHIDEDKIEAKFENGVLRLTFPKAESAKARKIDVKAA